MKSAREIIERVAAEVLAPRRILDVRQWAEKHRVLTEVSSEPGGYQTRRTPYAAEPMESCTAPHVRRIVLMMASQLMKTEFCFNVIGHAACERPRPALYAISNGLLADSYSKTRLQPAIAASPAWDAHAVEIGLRSMMFDRMPLALVGAHSAANLKGRPIGLLFCDELDDWPAGHLKLARERTSTFGDSLEIDASTPSDTGVGIEAEYETSDKRRYYVPCPHCLAYNRLSFNDHSCFWLTWDRNHDGTHPDPAEAERTACVVCPECGGEIVDQHKPGMLKKGIWLPEGERPAGGRDEVTRQGEAFDGSPVPIAGRAKRPNSSVRGYQLSQLYSPWVTFGELAREFAEDGYRITPGFVRGRLGEAWEEAHSAIDRSELDALRIEKRHGGFLTGEVPAQAPLLVTTIDVQEDRCYLLTLGFGAHMAEMAIIDFQEIESREGDALEPLDAVCLGLTYRCGKRRLRPLAIGIDTGHRTSETYAFVRRMHQAGWNREGRRAWPVKGDAKPGANQSWRTLHCETYPGSTTKMPAHLRLDGLLINTGFHKSALHGLIKESLRRRGGESERPDAGPLLVAENLPGVVLDGLVSERRVRVKKGGKFVNVWEKRAGRLGEFNHPLDLAVYARAIAERERLDKAEAQHIEKHLAHAPEE